MPRVTGRRLGTAAILVLLLVCGLIAPPAASASRSRADERAPHRAAPRVTIFYDYLAAPGSVGRAFRPHRFTFAEDPAYVVLQMHWGHWTRARATGRGWYYTDYGHGPYETTFGPYARKWRVRVTFWRPQRRCGHRVFTRARFVFPQHPGSSDTFVIGRPPPGFVCR